MEKKLSDTWKNLKTIPLNERCCGNCDNFQYHHVCLVCIKKYEKSLPYTHKFLNEAMFPGSEWKMRE